MFNGNLTEICFLKHLTNLAKVVKSPTPGIQCDLG